MKIGYSRVSTDTQTTEPQDIELKKAGCERIFSDVMSGRKFNRPGLEEMLTFARTGDEIVVVRLDRFGRSFRDLLNLIDLLKERQLYFRSLHENIETSSPAGALVLHVFGAIAQFERELIAERTKDGLEAARARGANLGRPSLPESKIAEACELVRAGGHIAEAAKIVGIGVSTLYRYLRG